MKIWLYNVSLGIYQKKNYAVWFSFLDHVFQRLMENVCVTTTALLLQPALRP